MMTPTERSERIERIRRFPADFEALVGNLSNEQLTTPYLDGEWTVQQIVHHVADSHSNSVIRLKLILTEEQPPLKGYDQETWAELADVNAVPIAAPLMMLKGLHPRWVALFEALDEADWTRAGLHSEIGPVTAEDLLRIYSEHGDEHIAHVKKVLAAGGFAL